MRILNYLRVIYYSIILYFEKYDLPVRPDIIRQQDRKNEKLARGVKHLVRYMRGLTPEQRLKPDNILMQAGRSKELTVPEKLEQAKAMAKAQSGPKAETEQAMAETFVKNQGKYKLQAQKRNVYKSLQSGSMDRKSAELELKRINTELKQYDS